MTLAAPILSVGVLAILITVFTDVADAAVLAGQIGMQVGILIGAFLGAFS